jgi:chromosome segregation ATPase
MSREERTELERELAEARTKLEKIEERLEEIESETEWDTDDDQFIDLYHDSLRESLECALSGVDLGWWEYILIGGIEAGELVKDRAPTDYRCGAVDYADSLMKGGWAPDWVRELESERDDLICDKDSLESDIEDLEAEIEELEMDDD